MYSRIFLALIGMTTLLMVGTIQAQSNQSQSTNTGNQSSLARQYEFVQSSSPLGNGRTVTRTQFTDQRRSELSISAPPVARTSQLQPRRTAFQQPAANTVPALGTPPAQLPNPNLIAPNFGPNRNPNCSSCAPNRNYYGQVYPYPVNNRPATFGPTYNNGPQPLLRLRTLPANAYIGQGIIGQPTAYVPGEPLRNVIRYIMP